MKEKELKLRSNEVCKPEVENENERKELAEEIEEIAAKKASLDQKRKANKRMVKRENNLKREKEKVVEKIIVLEKQVNGKQGVNVDQKIEELHGNLKVTEEELGDLKSLTQAPSAKVQSSNDELEETREELIKMFKKLPKSVHIGVKRMGELDDKPFYDAIKRKQKYNKTMAEDRALDLCSMWEGYLCDPNWHPFKEIAIDGISKEVIDKTDGKLKSLKRDLGEEVYKTVTTALSEMKKYNPSGRYVTDELWNFTQARKATLKEGVSCLLRMCIF